MEVINMPSANEMQTDADNINLPDAMDHILTNLTEITENILKFLPMKHLNCCSRVCTSWNKVVQKIKARRQQKAWMLYTGDEEDLNNREQIEAQVGLLSIEPQDCLLFTSSSLFETPFSVPATRSRASKHPARSAKQERVNFPEYLKRQLPPKCRLIGVVTDGIVGAEWGLSKLHEVEGAPAASCFLWPRCTGMSVYPFLYGRGGSESVDSQDPIGAFIPKDAVPKVVLLFRAHDTNVDSHAFGPALHKKYGGHVVLAGGIVDDLLYDDDVPHDPGEPHMLGYVFCGESIKMASVVMGSNVRTPKDVEKTLQKLKKCGIPEENSLGFMFACIGRGREWYNKENVESEAFKKLFPRTPLCGFFGNGEVGFEYLPNYNDVGMKQLPVMKSHPKLNHAYTTIFVLISYG